MCIIIHLLSSFLSCFWVFSFFLVLWFDLGLYFDCYLLCFAFAMLCFALPWCPALMWYAMWCAVVTCSCLWMVCLYLWRWLWLVTCFLVLWPFESMLVWLCIAFFVYGSLILPFVIISVSRLCHQQCHLCAIVYHVNLVVWLFSDLISVMSLSLTLGLPLT